MKFYRHKVKMPRVIDVILTIAAEQLEPFSGNEMVELIRERDPILVRDESRQIEARYQLIMLAQQGLLMRTGIGAAARYTRTAMAVDNSRALT